MKKNRLENLIVEYIYNTKDEKGENKDIPSDDIYNLFYKRDFNMISIADSLESIALNRTDEIVVSRKYHKMRMQNHYRSRADGSKENLAVLHPTDPGSSTTDKN